MKIIDIYELYNYPKIDEIFKFYIKIYKKSKNDYCYIILISLETIYDNGKSIEGYNISVFDS